jgi:6-pyruvoyl-tetrahydropterin synthase
VIVTLSLARPFIADHFHNLPGFVEEQHSHNWLAEATFLVTNKKESSCIKVFNIWVDQLQYSLLNDQKSLIGRNPTAESLAQWLFEFLESCNLGVTRVKIHEKENYWAAYGRRIT